MKKAIKLAIASALLSAGAMASADTTTQTSSTFTDITHLSSPINFGFSAFNSSLGTLNSVEVTFYSKISGSLGVENLGNAQTVTIGSGALLNLAVSGLTPIQVNTIYSQSFALPQFDGDDDFDGASGRYVSFTNQPVVSSTGVLNSSAALHAFTTAPFSVALTGVYAGVGPGNVSYLGTSQVDTYAVLSYNYTAAPVPEPETYAMMLAGLGLVGAIARRRKSA